MDPALPPLAYLVETVCLDEKGVLSPRAPIDGGCGQRRLRRADDRVRWRRHDWPGQGDRGRFPFGYQAGDTFLADAAEDRAVAVQIFDFGTGAGRRFGRRDPEDGGQAILVEPTSAHAFFTEDAAGGRQWFVRPQAGGIDLLRSWLLFAAPLPQGRASERIANLALARSPTGDHSDLVAVDSLTRFWRTRADVAFAKVPRDGDERHSSHELDLVVSEHYGAATIDESDHLERFFLARGFGFVRWERWEHEDRTRRPDAEVDAAARLVAESGRCPPLQPSAPPGAGWLLADCRQWTRFVETPDGFAAEDFDWPGAEVLGAALGD